MIENMEDFVKDFDSRMHRIFDERNVDGGMSVARMRELFAGLRQDLQRGVREDIAAEICRYGLGGPVKNAPARTLRTGSNTTSYALHFYKGKFHRVPEDWRFPTGTLHDIWMAFNCGDTVNNIPPIRSLNSDDVKHLDDIPIPEGGKRRRLARKTLSDMKRVCNYIQKMAQEQGHYRDGMTRAQLGDCFNKLLH